MYPNIERLRDDPQPRQRSEPSTEQHPQHRVQQSKQRIAEFNLPVRQGKSDRDGKWYDKPTQYPVALFDQNGVLIIDSEFELAKLIESDGYVSVRDDGRDDTISFRGGISQLAGYMTFEALSGKVWVNAHWRDRPTTTVLSPKMLALQELLRQISADEIEPGLTVYIGPVR